ncbi:hypothetical protein X975_04804, partial [Stegodyphus mimosarum]
MIREDTDESSHPLILRYRVNSLSSIGCKVRSMHGLLFLVFFVSTYSLCSVLRREAGIHPALKSLPLCCVPFSGFGRRLTAILPETCFAIGKVSAWLEPACLYLS